MSRTLQTQDRNAVEPWVPVSYQDIRVAFQYGVPIPLVSSRRPVAAGWRFDEARSPMLLNIDDPADIRAFMSYVESVFSKHDSRFGYVITNHINTTRTQVYTIRVVRRTEEDSYGY